MRSNTVAALLGIVAVASPMSTMAEDRPMGFFVTSEGMGNGGDLGGPRRRRALPETGCAAGAGGRTGEAYLSTEADGTRGISARDRIGNGPGTTRAAS